MQCRGVFYRYRQAEIAGGLFIPIKSTFISLKSNKPVKTISTGNVSHKHIGYAFMCKHIEGTP